jgi:hypothetical protein
MIEGSLRGKEDGKLLEAEKGILIGLIQTSNHSVLIFLNW